MNTAGLRVNSSKTQGLFIKFSRPKGYVSIWALGSGSNGSDLMSSGSNRGRRFQIRWAGVSRTRGPAAKGRRSRAPRRRSAGAGEMGATELRLDRSLAMEHENGMRKPPGHSGKGIRAWDVVRGGGALLGHGESRQRWCSDLGRGLQAYPTSVTGSRENC